MQEKNRKELEALGFNLFPLRQMAKEPIAGLNWKQFQSEKYNGVFPDSCNVAVICGAISDNLFVVDLDSFDIYDDIPEEMKQTYTIKTGKGYHLYYHYHGFPPPNRKLDDHRFRHVDIKSEGGYVLAAGSIHPTTKKPYEVFKDLPIKEMTVIRLNEILGELKFNVESVSLEELEKGVSEGSRDDTTFKMACLYIRKGFFGEALKFEVEKLNQRHKPPLPQKDIDRLIKSAERNERKALENHIKETQKIREDLKEDEPIKLKIQEIDPKLHEGIPVIFDCMMAGVGKRMTYTKQADMSCPVCGETEKIYCDEYYNFVIPRCNKDRISYEFVKGTKETAYIQQIIIEEFLEEARNSSPIEFDAEITDENVGEAFMGERKTVMAKFRSIPDGKGRNNPIFEILEMKNIEQKKGCMPEEEEIQSWKDCENFFERVTVSILPDLLMDIDIIESVILWGAGGTGLNGKRELINLAIIGDAQLGKSELALKMHKLLVGSGMTIGGKTSGAGLTIGMVKTHNGMMIPRAGFFPQYTEHHCIIDEVDKMGQPDQDSCLEVTEQMTVTLTKVGIPSMTLSARCPLLITGNPKGGKFNSKYPYIMDNFNMQVPFISRFDIVRVMRDKNDPELDRITRKFIRSFTERKEQYMEIEELQRYFTYVKSISATIPDELMDKIDELHTKMRPLNQENGLPIGWRQYHGLYRLITASATAHLRTVATQEDFDLVEKIITLSLESMKMDIETGKAGKVTTERTTKDNILLETVGECVDELKSVDKEEFISKLGERSPFNHLNAPTKFAELLKAGAFTLDNETERYTWVGLPSG